MIIMNINEWEKWYTKILDDFGFSREKDEEIAKILDNILNTTNPLTIEKLQTKIHEKKAVNNYIVFGAGPSLKNSIKEIKKRRELTENILVGADGATTALLEENIIPDIIVTDLDGKIDDLLIANQKNSIFIVHAHGDNAENITKYTPLLKNVLGTTQSTPHGNLYNFGGFTDGDRAIFLTLALNANKITLVGMDFGEYVTKYSRPNIKKDVEPADEIKQKKLKYAEELVEWIKENKNVEINKI